MRLLFKMEAGEAIDAHGTSSFEMFWSAWHTLQLHPHFWDACCRSLSVVPRGLPLKDNFCIRTYGSIGLVCGFVSSCVLSHSLGLLMSTCRFTKIWPRY